MPNDMRAYWHSTWPPVYFPRRFIVSEYENSATKETEHKIAKRISSHRRNNAPSGQAKEKAWVNEISDWEQWERTKMIPETDSALLIRKPMKHSNHGLDAWVIVAIMKRCDADRQSITIHWNTRHTILQRMFLDLKKCTIYFVGNHHHSTNLYFFISQGCHQQEPIGPQLIEGSLGESYSMRYNPAKDIKAVKERLRRNVQSRPK